MIFQHFQKKVFFPLGDVKCGLEIGDIVTSKSMKWPWQTHFIADPNDLEKVPQEMHNDLPKLASCIGLIGLTVLLGIRKKGGLKHFAQLLSSNERYYYISTILSVLPTLSIFSILGN